MACKDTVSRYSGTRALQPRSLLTRTRKASEASGSPWVMYVMRGI